MSAGFPPESGVMGCAQCGFKTLEVPPVYQYMQSHLDFSPGKKSVEPLFFCPKCGYSGHALSFRDEKHRGLFLKSVKRHRFRPNFGRVQ